MKFRLVRFVEKNAEVKKMAEVSLFHAYRTEKVYSLILENVLKSEREIEKVISISQEKNNTISKNYLAYRDEIY